MKDVVLYATDTMADWEYGYLVAGLSMAEGMNPGRFRLLTASDGPRPEVRTAGRIRIVPDTTLESVSASDLAALILPGADTWGAGHDAALDLARQCETAGIPVAAICGATLGLARAGLLNDRGHTSNAPEFLASVPEYTGVERYRAEKSVSDRGVITAPATAPVDFTRAVFEALELFPQPTIDAWYGLYTTGEKKYFDRLTGSAQ